MLHRLRRVVREDLQILFFACQLATAVEAERGILTRGDALRDPFRLLFHPLHFAVLGRLRAAADGLGDAAGLGRVSIRLCAGLGGGPGLGGGFGLGSHCLRPCLLLGLQPLFQLIRRLRTRLRLLLLACTLSFLVQADAEAKG